MSDFDDTSAYFKSIAHKIGFWLYKSENFLRKFLPAHSNTKAVPPSSASADNLEGKTIAKPTPKLPQAKHPGSPKSSWLKTKLNPLFNVVFEVIEPLYWPIAHLGRLKERPRLRKAINLFREHYVLIFTLIIGYILARGILIFPARHIVIYAAIPVILIIAFAKPVLALVFYLFFSLGMFHKAIWNFPKLYLGSPLLLLAIVGWALSTFKGREKAVQFVQDSNNLPALGLWTWATVLFLLNYSTFFDTANQIGWLLAFFVCVHIVGKDKNKLTYMLYALGIIFAFYTYKVLRLAAYYGFGTEYTIAAGIPGRMADNNELAAALNMALPIFYTLFIYERKEWRRIAWLVVFALDILAILCTRSRGGYIALIIVFTLIFFKMIVLGRRKAVPIIFLVLFTLGAYSVFYEKVNSRIADIANWQEDQSAKNRILSIITGWEMLRAHPLTGIGIGRGDQYFLEYCPLEIKVPTGWREEDYVIISRPSQQLVLHNAYSQMAGEAGIPGILFFLFLLIGSIAKMHRLRRVLPRKKKNEWVFPLSQALEIGIISYMLTAMFLGNARQGFIYVLLAFTTILWNVAVKEEKPKPAAISGIMITWLLFLFGFWLYMTVGWRV